jgi:hypothetical protein
MIANAATGLDMMPPGIDWIALLLGGGAGTGKSFPELMEKVAVEKSASEAGVKGVYVTEEEKPAAADEKVAGPMAAVIATATSIVIPPMLVDVSDAAAACGQPDAGIPEAKASGGKPQQADGLCCPEASNDGQAQRMQQPLLDSVGLEADAGQNTLAELIKAGTDRVTAEKNDQSKLPTPPIATGAESLADVNSSAGSSEQDVEPRKVQGNAATASAFEPWLAEAVNVESLAVANSTLAEAPAAISPLGSQGELTQNQPVPIQQHGADLTVRQQVGAAVEESSSDQPKVAEKVRRPSLLDKVEVATQNNTAPESIAPATPSATNAQASDDHVRKTDVSSATVDRAVEPEPPAKPAIAFQAVRLAERMAGPEMHFAWRNDDGGQVQVSASVHQREVQLAVSTERPDAAIAIRAEVPSLDSRLQEHSLRLGEVRVVADERALSSGLGTPSDGRGNREWNGASVMRNSTSAEVPLEEEVPARTMLRGSGHVSLLA